MPPVEQGSTWPRRCADKSCAAGKRTPHRHEKVAPTLHGAKTIVHSLMSTTGTRGRDCRRPTRHHSPRGDQGPLLAVTRLSGVRTSTVSLPHRGCLLPVVTAVQAQVTVQAVTGAPLLVTATLAVNPLAHTLGWWVTTHGGAAEADWLPISANAPTDRAASARQPWHGDPLDSGSAPRGRP